MVITIMANVGLITPYTGYVRPSGASLAWSSA